MPARTNRRSLSVGSSRVPLGDTNGEARNSRANGPNFHKVGLKPAVVLLTHVYGRVFRS